MTTTTTLSEKYVLFPIKYPSIWSMYKKHVTSFWITEEIDLSQDYKGWNELSTNEQQFIKMVLGFFAASDGIVFENLALRFIKEMEIPEVRCFYGFQMAIENIHSETYSLLIDTLIKDKTEQDQLFHALENFESISKKANWALKWITSDSSLTQRLVAFAIVEGIFFSGSFCAIFWLKKRGIKMPGLIFSNELISRDEGLHTEFAILLYSILDQRLPEGIIHQMMEEAINVEKSFIIESLEVELIGMNSSLMIQYICFVADRLLKSLGYSPLYHVTNPFEWMITISMQGKTNFFEKRVSDYSLKTSSITESIYEQIDDF
jgi:ribonucleotide reductase beta subunit family protein with ferritin-like domain